MVKLAILCAMACLAGAGCGGNGTEEPDPGVAGTYTVDRDSVRPVFLEQVRKDHLEKLGTLTEEQETHLLALADSWADAMHLDMTLRDDGSFEVSGLMQEKTLSLKGTWKRDGDAVVWTTTEKNGVVQDEPAVKRATLRAGVLHLRPDPALPFEFILRRK